MSESKALASSFRDPAGFVFQRDGLLYRQINHSYAEHYDFLISSGLYDVLVGEGLLVRHDEGAEPQTQDAYKTIQPEQIPYISYPYEWSFSQFKAAALLTLRVQQRALAHGMSLKDASAYNVQFIGARPVFIDTLSFEKTREGEPWVAYKQFCEHFLNPLALMSRVDVRLRRLSMSFIDGLPLDMVSAVLPRSTYLTYSLLAHIHLHAASQKRHADDGLSGPVAKPRKMSPAMLSALIASLEKAVSKCRLTVSSTEWGDYYHDTNYTSEAMSEKEKLVLELVTTHCKDVGILHDFGANTGRFSQLLAKEARYVVSHDIDELAVDRHHTALQSHEYGDRILPLLVDLTNPAPAIGWNLSERLSFTQRVRADLALSLALIHHLAISNNTPLGEVARFFAEIARCLVIEFVPKEDSQVQRLLASREDVFPDYHLDGFETAFSAYFEIVDRRPIEGTKRVLYFMTGRADSS